LGMHVCDCFNIVKVCVTQMSVSMHSIESISRCHRMLSCPDIKVQHIVQCGSSSDVELILEEYSSVAMARDTFLFADVHVIHDYLSVSIWPSDR